MFMDTLTATKRGSNINVESMHLLCEHRKNKFTVKGGRFGRQPKRASQVGDVDPNNLS